MSHSNSPTPDPTVVPLLTMLQRRKLGRAFYLSLPIIWVVALRNQRREDQDYYRQVTQGTTAPYRPQKKRLLDPVYKFMNEAFGFPY